MRSAILALLFVAWCSPAVEPTSRQRLPDEVTVTGLAAVAGGYVAANDGRMKRGDDYAPSLVFLDASFRPIRTVTAAALGLPSSASVQGLAAVPEGIWVAWQSDSTLRLVSGDRVVRTVAAPFKPNGLAMTPEGLVISEIKSRRIRWVETGREMTLLEEPDHLFWHDGALWYSWGANGEDGRITRVGGETIILAGADAVEGFLIEAGRLRVANDAYFHEGDPKENAVLTYPAP